MANIAFSALLSRRCTTSKEYAGLRATAIRTKWALYIIISRAQFWPSEKTAEPKNRHKVSAMRPGTIADDEIYAYRRSLTIVEKSVF
jgi:hypothetical protein